MSKHIKNTLIAVCIFLFTVSLLMCFTVLRGTAESFIYYADSFQTELMTVTPDVDEYGIKGVGLTSKYKSATAEMANKVCGDTEIAFSFVNDNANTYLKELEIEFSDENGKGFSVVAENNLSGINVCVSIYGNKHGLFYEGEDLASKTLQNNGIGIYTKLNSADIYTVSYEKEYYVQL